MAEPDEAPHPPCGHPLPWGEGGKSLGVKTSHLPLTRALDIQKPVVQAAGAALPEFDLAGDDADAGPIGGARDRSEAEFHGQLGDFLHEMRAAREFLTLPRCPPADLAQTVPGFPISVRLRIADNFGAPLNSDLAMELFPEEGQGRPPASWPATFPLPIGDWCKRQTPRSSQCFRSTIRPSGNPLRSIVDRHIASGCSIDLQALASSNQTLNCFKGLLDNGNEAGTKGLYQRARNRAQAARFRTID